MKCSCCGKEIGEIVFDSSFNMPDEIWKLSKLQRLLRAKIGSDLSRFGERFFLRGVAYIPVKDTDRSYGWGIWVEVSKDDFDDYFESFEEDNSSKPKFAGIVANEIPYYENTTGLKVEVQLGNETQRPEIYFSDQSHLLTKEQTDGISLEKVHSFSSSQS